MTIFFELLKKKIGFSRIGRLSIIKQDKRYFLTPNIIIPLHSSFANQADFIDQFKDHDFFMFSEETYFKKDFFKENVESKNFIFTHKGTLDKFQEIISRYKQEIIRNNIIVLIPFNIPTTAINKDFAEQEVKNYLNSVNIILKNHSDLLMG